MAWRCRTSDQELTPRRGDRVGQILIKKFGHAAPEQPAIVATVVKREAESVVPIAEDAKPVMIVPENEPQVKDQIQRPLTPNRLTMPWKRPSRTARQARRLHGPHEQIVVEGRDLGP
jgi:hypothetical protein